MRTAENPYQALIPLQGNILTLKLKTMMNPHQQHLQDGKEKSLIFRHKQNRLVYRDVHVAAHAKTKASHQIITVFLRIKINHFSRTNYFSSCLNPDKMIQI